MEQTNFRSLSAIVNEFLKVYIRMNIHMIRYRTTEMLELEKLSSLPNFPPVLAPSSLYFYGHYYMRILCKVRPSEETRTCEEEEFAVVGTNIVTHDDPLRYPLDSG